MEQKHYVFVKMVYPIYDVRVEEWMRDKEKKKFDEMRFERTKSNTHFRKVVYKKRKEEWMKHLRHFIMPSVQ